MVGNLSLATTTDSQKEAMFGLPTVRGTDGIHYRGAVGSSLLTNSIVEGLTAASSTAAQPTGWSTQSRRGAASTPALSTSTQVPTANRFLVLNC